LNTLGMMYSGSSSSSEAIPGRGQLHGLVDRARADVQRTSEDTREGEHVVDLIRIVRAPGGHDPHVVADVLGLHLGRGIGHREDDRSGAHSADGGHRDGTGPGQSEVDIRAREQLVGDAVLAPGVGALSERGALGVEPRTVLPLIVSAQARSTSSRIAEQTRATPGV